MYSSTFSAAATFRRRSLTRHKRPKSSFSGSLQCRAARFLSREASYGGGLPRVSPLRVGIVTHNAAANRLTLPFLPRLRPVANGGFFLKRRPPPRVGLVRAPARIGGIDSP